MTDTRFTDPNVDPAAGAPGALALLRGSRWISEPAPDQRWDGTKHLNVEGWAYAEVGCGDTPTVSFRVPLDDHGWACMSTDDVTVFASMLIRLAGVARTWTALDAEGCDLP